MAMMKKTAIGAGGLLTLCVAAVILLVFGVGGAGQSPIENWIAGQLRLVVNDYLVVECDFDSLDYQAPLTVVVTNLRLTADDPDNPGRTIDFITADRAKLTLAELPREGRPLRIKALELQRPTFKLIDARDGSGLIGFTNLVEPDPNPGPDTPAVSEVLQITRIDVKDGSLIYDARTEGAVPMAFQGIETGIDIHEDKPNIYRVAVDLSQGPVFNAKLDSECNLDDLTIGIEKFTLDMKVHREQDRYLPPQVQRVLRDHDIRGDAKLTATGLFNANDWRASTVEAQLELTDGHATLAEYMLPLDVLRLEATMAERRVEVRRIAADLFSGKVRGDAVIQLNEDFDTDIRLGADQLDLEQTLKPIEGAPRYSGRLDFDVSVQMPLGGQADGPRLFGRGKAELRRGRVARLAVISDVIDFMASRGDLKKRDEDGSDRGDARFELRGDHVYIDQIEVVGTWFAMRGRGEVFFNDRLNMNLNAGPMQRAQASLGRIGDVFGTVTDNLIAYRVRGSFADPKVGIAPLSGLLGAPGERDRNPDRSYDPAAPSPNQGQDGPRDQ